MTGELRPIQQLMVRDLNNIIEWATDQLAYVQEGSKAHPAGEDETFLYRYIRGVACAI